MFSINIMTNKEILLILFSVLILSAGCTKDYGYEFEDGVDSGAETSNVTVDTAMSTIDRSLYHKARIFPGMVAATETRLENHEVELDLNYVPTEYLRVNVPPRGVHSVGLYAPAGELIKVVVPPGVEGLTLQIGVHTDNLTGKTSLRRDPVIYTVKALFPGVNYLRNLYGGLIWIKSRQPIEAPVNVKFTGAVKSPDFILGESQDGEWLERLRESSVPWLELRSKHVIYTMQREILLRLVSKGVLKSPTAVLEEWDNIYEKDFYNWMGLTVGNPDYKHRAPDLPERGVLDIQISAGYGHNGYPWMAQLDEGWSSEWVDINSIKGGGSWGSYHEVGHNYQQGNWSWDGLGETTNNLFIFKGAHRNNSFPTHPALPEQFPIALAFAAEDGAKDFDAEDNPFFKLVPFVQLFNLISNPATGEDGWEFMAYLYTKTRDAQRLSNNIQDRKDFFYEALCDFTQRDYFRFMSAWGIPVSAQSRSKVEAKGYPAIKTEIWKYNPLTNEGGDTPIPTKFDYPRADWEAIGLSSEEPAEGAAPQGRIAAMFDGNVNTHWHSQWAGANPPPPHYFILDMKAALDVKGLYFHQRFTNQTRAQEVEIEISEDNVSWTDLGNFPLLNNNSRQEIVFDQLKEFRYIRITFNKYNYNGGVHAAMAEFGAFYDED
ncbi:M60 family metallopeptidase [Albibacterium profundi]|uniref:M60 family metallopeptidase n=1 Tax=Albibacterium profundi TaxID=3134906 RepID=A0ABV5CCG5_9SPHI